MIIEAIDAVKILDSRSDPTISVFLKTKDGRVQASVPSGKSKGKHEIDTFSSKGMDFSISFIKLIGRKLIESKIQFKKFEDLEKIVQQGFQSEPLIPAHAVDDQEQDLLILLQPWFYRCGEYIWRQSGAPIWGLIYPVLIFRFNIAGEEIIGLMLLL